MNRSPINANPIVTHQVPFSCKGSWFSFFRKNPGLAGGKASAPLSLRILAGTLWEAAEVFDIELERDGALIPWGESLQPELLTLAAADGKGGVRIAFQDAAHARLRAEGVALVLDSCRNVSRLGQSGWRVHAGSQSWLLLAAVEGSLAMQKRGERWCLRLNGENQAAEVIVKRVTTGGVPPIATGPFDQCVAAQCADLQAWHSEFPPAPVEFSALRERELNALWNLTVGPLGNVRREITLVSKGSLIGLWSWDHCWHMLGAASARPELAWNNFMSVFDHQDVTGALPDVFCANQVCWGHVKPPVHGWMLGLLEEKAPWFSDSHRREIYGPLGKLTEFWLRECDEDGDGVPHYLHGCDSGWDNATVFDAGSPIETPDLSAWLVLQQEWLAKTARRLGLETEARRWEEGAKTLLRKLLEHFWTGNRFVARLSGTHEPVDSESLLLRIPLILGDRLPVEARRWCLDGIRAGERYRTDFGILSEPKDSPLFNPDGYWRGAMWPVTVFIFAEAFRVNGETGEASALARSYLELIARQGNFENYRGDTGEGVRDASIAWSATCALLLLSYV